MRKNILIAAMAIFALFAAGTSGAVAAGMITGKDIENRSITGVDLDRNSVGTPHIRPGSVRGHDLSENSVGWYNHLNAFTQRKIENLAGQDGADGTDGTDGVSGYESAGVEVTIPAGEQNFVREQVCPEGKVALGGGFKTSGEGSGDIAVDHSMPGGWVKTDSGEWRATSWIVQVDNNSASSGTEQLVSYVTCATLD